MSFALLLFIPHYHDWIRLERLSSEKFNNYAPILPDLLHKISTGDRLCVVFSRHKCQITFMAN